MAAPSIRQVLSSGDPPPIGHIPDCSLLRCHWRGASRAISGPLTALGSSGWKQRRRTHPVNKLGTLHEECNVPVQRPRGLVANTVRRRRERSGMLTAPMAATSSSVRRHNTLMPESKNDSLNRRAGSS